MKKVSLLIAMMLVLLSGIVFSACDNGYKNLNISCNVEELNLVLDDDGLSSAEVIFELSGAKSWGEISIVSEPAGLVHTAYQIVDKQCGVVVSALQPSDEGARLIFKHLGSGKSCSIPLKIGMKLKSLESLNMDFVIALPEFEADEAVTKIEIPTSKLLNPKPFNYTDNIVWDLPSLTDKLPGVELQSYDAEGNLTSAFNYTGGEGALLPGTSKAIKSSILINRTCLGGSFVMRPISVLNGDAVLYTNIQVRVHIINLLNENNIKATSSTHGDIDGNLKDLVLISNPDPGNPRDNNGVYDYYSTSLIELKMEAGGYASSLYASNPRYLDLYKIELSSDIDGLKLEDVGYGDDNIDFGKIRVIASNTCVGTGNIKIKFVPKSCVGDIKQFTITIPCTVGERATSFKATNNGSPIAIKQNNNYQFEAITPLNDAIATSLGQIFRFEVLTTNTLDALSSYKIVLESNLLYIDENKVTTEETGKKTIANIKYESEAMADLTRLLDNKYKYQISILKDGRDINFYYDEGNNTLTSEPLFSRNTIYMKWVNNNDVDTIVSNFGIKVLNFYNESYDIVNNEFNKTCITLDLAFDRQRTVESITYLPIQVTTDGGTKANLAEDAEEDWQFYFEKTMFDEQATYYGFQISNIYGINGTELTQKELDNIDIKIELLDVNIEELGIGNLGFTSYIDGSIPSNFQKEYLGYKHNRGVEYFNFSNIVLIGKVDANDVPYGDYQIKISQNNRIICSQKLKVYKSLSEEDVKVNLPSADFEGKYLQYEQVVEFDALGKSIQPSDWLTNWNAYYEYSGGWYIPVENSTWNPNKIYYKQIVVNINDSGASKELELDNTYIVAINKNYIVNIDILNDDFANIKSQSVISNKILPTTGTNNVVKNGVTTSVDNAGNYIVRTGLIGSFNSDTNEKNYVQLICNISAYKYDYYKLTEETISIEKVIYLYVYEPLTEASFNKSMLYKYNNKTDNGTVYIKNAELRTEYGKETLKIELNNDNIFNYIDVKWHSGNMQEPTNVSEKYATFNFGVGKSGQVVTGSIGATLVQFGIQYPIYCGYEVREPIISEQVVLENDENIHSFKSGGSYINLKAGDQVDIKARAISSKGLASVQKFNYFICNNNGYKEDSVATIDLNGCLQALSAGRVKLIIVASDALKTISTSDYFKTGEYIYNNAYVMIDVLVSDGSQAYPYLIASVDDFKAIQSGDSNHYALVNDINLNGISFNISEFKGVISSYQETAISNNRFNVYGVMLDETNPTLFAEISQREDGLANLRDIDFHVNINYIETNSSNAKTYIGLIGINNGLIENITLKISGNIDGKNASNVYVIGPMVASNTNKIILTDKTLVGVEGDIVVKNTTSISTVVVLGGVIGENYGSISGAHLGPYIEEDDDLVKYDVYYGNQGATSDILLQVKGVGNQRSSAIGGVIGYNNGTMTNVYSTGKILGIDDSNALVVSNVGGLIGQNMGAILDNRGNPINYPYNIQTSIQAIDLNGDDKPDVNKVVFNSDNFQVVNSYSSAQVLGKDNVGGAVGYDEYGSYKKVYYEMYYKQINVQGKENVGGLIGCAKDSNLYYCYANSFAWDYSNTVNVYDVVGTTNVGGLVGYAKSSKNNGNFIHNSYATYYAMNIVNSLASVSISSALEAGGLVGYLQGFGTIYNAYYYGVINPSVTINPITKAINGEAENIAYNNVYSIVNGIEKVNQIYTNNVDGSITINANIIDFNISSEYNNGKPYLVYIDGTNLVSIIPTIIQVNQAFKDTYYYDNNINLYRINSEFGDYVRIEGNMVKYEPGVHQGRTRYSLIASRVDTFDPSGNDSDYRTHALVLYYYQFKDMTGENALTDLYYLNTIDMHKIINDDGIIVLPNTIKRFNLKSSNNDIVTVLNGGKLLLRSEGQVTITLISALNPSVTASFVVIVRTKVQEFGLYSNANLRDEYNVSNKTISIVKDSSKLLYANYSSIIKVYGRQYEYVPATNMKIKFTISYNGATLDGNIKDYVILNGAENGGEYFISYGVPITVSVLNYAEETFTIRAIPYIVVNYINGEYNWTEEIELNHYMVHFNIATKKGATAINTDHTQLDMMPADEKASVSAKINTDMEVDKLIIEISSVGSEFEIDNINKHYTGTESDTIAFVEMLDVYYRGSLIDFDEENDILVADIVGFGAYDNVNKLQTLSFSLKLNKKSHYVDKSFRLQIKLSLENGVSTIFHIDVKPQEITSLMALNYRINEEDEEKFENAYLSQVIRPGTSNIITIDLAPSIAIYDSVEIKDLTTADKILFQQVDEDLNLLDEMDTWIDSGISLKKYGFDTSKLYVKARLPLSSTFNITHNIQIAVYDKDKNVIKVSHLNLEAVMYPRVVMTYTYPNGISVNADTNYGNAQQEITVNADLAVGVEAGIDIKTYNIDEGSLQGNITIKDLHGGIIVNDNLLSLNYEYDKYVLRFNANNKDSWDSLVGKTIEVSFTASKQLNGIVETCKATICFNVKRMVIHGVSMTREGSSGKLYGNWDESFSTQIYFDKTDISYYNNGYWNIQYTINTTYYQDIVDEQTRNDFKAINDLLMGLNNLNGGTEIYLGDVGQNDIELMESIRDGYNNDNISIRNNNNTYIIKAGKDCAINDKKLVVEFRVDYDNQNYPKLSASGSRLVDEFGFDIAEKSTPFDEYLTVSSQQEFEDMQVGRYYRLTKDLIFTNYTPINTAIGGFNGDGYTITIKRDTRGGLTTNGFNEAQLVQNYITEGMYIGLFGVVSEDSVVQNIQVKYDVVLNLNNSTLIQEQHTNRIYFGGIAGVNLGVITNVKVLGKFELLSQYISAENINLGGIASFNGQLDVNTKTATITGSEVELQMSAMALVGGISGYNYGKITNTGFKGKIESNDANEYASNIFTAGFVVENMHNGYISLSYVEPKITVGQYNIHSVGRTAGFVFNNVGSISNSYINQTAIRSQGNIGGFVYQSSGTITNCYAYPTLGNSLFYEEFIYSVSDVGGISNCYVVTDSEKNMAVKGLNRIPTGNLSAQEQYKGFIFAERDQGVWYISESGPFLPHSGFNEDKTTYNDIYNIYDVETFEGFFNSNNAIIEGKSFRMVRDINFDTTIVEGNPITFNKTLRASIEGNDMVISNYNIYKQGSADSVGLFANIINNGLGTYLRNLILKPESIKATGSCVVGALAGTIDSANIYNVVIDNSKMLILGKNAVGGLAGIIKGDFEVMGITSNVSTFASYTYNKADQYNLYTGKNVTNSVMLDNISSVSYAGSVAGIVNGYNNSTFDSVNRNIDTYYNIADITLTGDVVVIGETVGGAFGLVGERTLVTNIKYNLPSETLYQGTYVSGGLVGENRGFIQDSRIYSYDESDSNKQINTKACFDGLARVNGGIVGLNIGGMINNCISDIRVHTSKEIATVGGIVGRNIEGYVYNCTVSGDLSAFIVGGMIGSDYSYSIIIQQNSGYGTATSETKRVYNNIKVEVKYDTNYFEEFDVTKPFKDNTLTDKFIKNFLTKKSKYYSFNNSYVTAGETNLVDTSMAFGFIIGITDSDYGINIDSTTYNNMMNIDVSTDNNVTKTSYMIKYNNIEKDVMPISNIIAPKDFDLGINYPAESTNVIYLYIIAYENSSYEFWSSILGYGDEYVALSHEPLTEIV